jgi:hypothetical protein
VFQALALLPPATRARGEADVRAARFEALLAAPTQVQGWQQEEDPGRCQILASGAGSTFAGSTLTGMAWQKRQNDLLVSITAV